MGNDNTGQGSWDLFAERQVHIRDGRKSRYVVLSRSLQIGVAAACLTILALLGIAAYQAIGKQVQLVAQQRTLEDLAALAAQADQSARELATLRQRSDAAQGEIERLTSALEQAQAERTAAVTASTEAGARAAELEAALAATTEERRKLASELVAARATGDLASAPRSTEMQALLAEVTGLRAELDRVHREAESLRRSAAQARQALRDLQSSSAGQTLSSQGLPEPRAEAPPGVRSDGSAVSPPLRLALAATPTTNEVRRLQQDLAGAQATIAALSADLEAVKGAGTNAAVALDAVADLATLEEQLDAAQLRAEQLGANLAAQQSEAVAGEVPADRPPLPPPPAPR
jgi:chromosome segregation ATPase